MSLCISTIHAKTIDVITHPSINIDSLTTSQLRRIYSMRQVKWADGKPIVVFVLPSSSQLHKDFCKQTLRIFPYQLDLMWNKLIFSGLGVAPTTVNTTVELLTAVKSTPGAIGYIEKVTKDEEINVITITK